MGHPGTTTETVTGFAAKIQNDEAKRARTRLHMRSELPALRPGAPRELRKTPRRDAQQQVHEQQPSYECRNAPGQGRAPNRLIQGRVDDAWF